VPFYLRPSAPTAPDALICGDPTRALVIAQHVMRQPRMSNHNRGLWGYHGETRDGMPITVQATGIGGPSAVAVLGESVDLGVRRLIRVGTGVADGDDPELGASIVVAGAIAADGTSRHLGAAEGEVLNADAGLTTGLIGATGAGAEEITSVDLMAAGGESLPLGADRPRVADLQTAAVLALGRRRSVAVGAALVIREAAGRRLHDDPLEAALLRLTDAAVTALQLSTST
jgi:purine-nucleoside phosphorylase